MVFLRLMRRSGLIISVLVLILAALVGLDVFMHTLRQLPSISQTINATSTTTMINTTSPKLEVTCRVWNLVNVTLSNGSYIFISVPRETPVYLLSKAQFKEWGVSSMPPVNYTWFDDSPGVFVVAPPQGDYEVAFCGSVNVTLRVFKYMAMGVAAYYGPNYGNLTTDAVMGIFNITNANVEWSTGTQTLGFSLQLNAYLVVKYSGGVVVHWVQDALLVSSGQYWFQAEMDVTNYIGSSQSLMYENGVCISGCFKTPMSGMLIITVNTTKYGVVVNYGYALFRLGNIRLNPVVHWVAHQVIPIPNATAYLITSLNPGPYYMPMDTELVVGGPGNSGGVMFRSLSAQLALYYWNGTSWAPYPVTYTFGASTGEYAVNVSVEPIGPASVELSTGPNNYQVLS